MVVYLVPAARNRHELYFEAPDDSPHHPEPPPGLFRRWAFTCNHSAPSIAAALRRVVQLRDAPARWLFAQTERI